MIRNDVKNSAKQRYLEALIATEFHYPLPSGKYINIQRINILKQGPLDEILFTGLVSNKPPRLNFRNELWQDLMKKYMKINARCSFRFEMKARAFCIRITKEEINEETTTSIFEQLLTCMHMRNSASLRTRRNLFTSNRQAFQDTEESVAKITHDT